MPFAEFIIEEDFFVKVWSHVVHFVHCVLIAKDAAL